MDDKKLEKEAEDWIFKTQAYIASAKVRENQIEKLKGKKNEKE